MSCFLTSKEPALAHFPKSLELCLGSPWRTYFLCPKQKPFPHGDQLATREHQLSGCKQKDPWENFTTITVWTGPLKISYLPKFGLIRLWLKYIMCFWWKTTFQTIMPTEKKVGWGTSVYWKDEHQWLVFSEQSKAQRKQPTPRCTANWNQIARFLVLFPSVVLIQ